MFLKNAVDANNEKYLMYVMYCMCEMIHSVKNLHMPFALYWGVVLFGTQRFDIPARFIS